MADEILIIDNTIEEIEVEEFNGVPTGTIITTTHGYGKGEQHSIEDITGLKTKLDNIEKLKPVRSNLSGHADYYLWGDTEDIGPGYFVRLGEDGMIYKCTNETVVVRPTDLPLDTDENGNVIIYALAGNITTADINKYYVVGTEALYDIYGYDGAEYVQKSAYSYDGEQVIKTCHTTDILGVTVSSAGFIGNDENIVDTYTSAKATDINYALVATSGVVDVLCGHDIIVGDYVFPTASGWAAKSTGSYGYLVTALVQNGVVVQEANEEEILYARIVLSQSMVNAKKVSDNVDYLLAETQRIGENVVKAVSDAQTALDEVRNSDSNLSDRVNNFESSMNAMGEQLHTNTIVVNNANNKAAEAERVANQAKEYVDEVVATTGGDAASALADASYAKAEVEKLAQSMTPIIEYTNERGEIVGAAGIVNKQDELGGVVADIQTWREDDVSGYAATVKRVGATETSISNLTQFETDTKESLAQIKQKSDETGSSITALTSKIDKYSVGEYSQAYGLTQAQAADILEAGKIVFIPTNFVSSDASFIERYNPIALESWSNTDKNTKYIYKVEGNYYYYNGTSWTPDTISNMQSRGYCVTNFEEHYSYVWNGLKWVPETAAINVFFTDDPRAEMASPSPLYWVVGSGHCISKTATEWSALITKDTKKEYYITDTKKYYYYNGATWTEATKPQYKIGGLYLAVYNSTLQIWEWKECALGSSNSMSRVSALVEQTQNSWQASISNVKGDMAALSSRVDENGSNVAMVASVVKEVTGVNLDFADNTEKTPYASKNDIVSTDKTKYFVVGTRVPYDIYYYNGTTYVQKVNWSYDGQRVLQPNTASIVTSANEDGSGILLNASHIKFEGETYTVNAGNIDFTGNNYKINADRIELAGSTTFSNYAQLEDVVKEQRVEYATSTSNTEAPTNGWDTDYPTREQGEYIWRRVIVIKGNDDQIPGTPELITPSDGKDGTSVSIKGTASSVTNIGDGLYTITFKAAGASTATTVLNGALGDGYIYNGDLYVCVKVTSGADHFSNVGQIQGPQGASGASLQIRYKVKQDGQTITKPTNPDSEGWSVNMPTSGVIYMTQKLSNTTAWSTPIQITGKDGDPGKDGSDIEYVYYRCNTSTFNTEPNGNITAVPPKNNTWTTSPNGVTESQQYEYVSVRTKQAGATSFGPWSTPTIWSKWGDKGQDGDGVEYLYCLKQTKDAPTVSTKWHNTLPSGWTDEPTGTSEDYPYEYVIQIKSTDTTEKEFTGKLWGVYDGMLALYAKSTGVPSTPTGEGSTASSSENTTWQKTMPTSLTETQVIYASYKTFLGTSWSSPVKIYAVDGKDGTSVSIKGTADSVTPVEGETNKFALIYNGTIVRQGALGDGYIYNGDLYVCVKVNDTVDFFENVGEIKGDTGASIIGVETYYYVTCNVNPFRDADGNPLESPNDGYGIEEPPQNSNEWINDIKSIGWGDKYAYNKTTAVTTSEKAAYIYQYLWVREKYTYSDHTEEHSHIEWTNPRLDATNTTIGNWCAENDKTVINGGTIATGSITAKQIATDAIQSQGYEPDVTGSFLNLADGSFDSKNFKIDSDGSVIASDVELTGGTIKSENFKKTEPTVWGDPEGLSYVLSDDQGSYIVENIGTCTDIEIIIPATYNGLPVTSIGDNAFANCSSLTSVEIPDSVISIGKSAFSGCSSLTSITLPFVGATKDGTSNTYFGYIFGAHSFLLNQDYVPTSLKKVTITIATSIDDYAFYYCTSLTSIVIPDSVTKIGNSAFYYCRLESVIIPSSVTSIQPDAFKGCSKLTIYCEAENQPTGWKSNWNSSSRPVYWYSETAPSTDGNYWHYDGEGFKISANPTENMIDSPYFKVTQDGKIKAINGEFTGAITAGTISGFHITDNHLASGQPNDTNPHLVMLSGNGWGTGDEKDYAFWAGDKEPGGDDSTRPFWIKTTGELGAIRGTIGGCTLSATGLSINTTDEENNSNKYKVELSNNKGLKIINNDKDLYCKYDNSSIIFAKKFNETKNYHASIGYYGNMFRINSGNFSSYKIPGYLCGPWSLGNANNDGNIDNYKQNRLVGACVIEITYEGGTYETVINQFDHVLGAFPMSNSLKGWEYFPSIGIDLSGGTNKLVFNGSDSWVGATLKLIVFGYCD